MKKFLTALTILLILTAQVEAAPFTREQAEKIFMVVESFKGDSTLNLNVETFTEKFNRLITAVLKETLETEDISSIEHLFLIKDYKIFSKPDGDFFAHVFGDYRVAIVGTCAADGNFKVLSLYYTTPEEKDEAIFAAWRIVAFAKSISPEIDVKKLMDELTAENSSGTVIGGDIKFSITADGNLNVLTATLNQ